MTKGEIITLIIGLILSGLWIYAMIVYGDMPLSEVPIWVYWLLK